MSDHDKIIEAAKLLGFEDVHHEISANRIYCICRPDWDPTECPCYWGNDRIDCKADDTFRNAGKQRVKLKCTREQLVMFAALVAQEAIKQALEGKNGTPTTTQ